MISDYRFSTYCKPFEDIIDKKIELTRDFNDHRTFNHYNLLRNTPAYKQKFLIIYNNRCSYCGVNTQIIPLSHLEIDHYIYKKNPSYSQELLNNIDNLVLSCHDCNNKKRAFLIQDILLETLHPDKNKICDVFYRKENFRIEINPTFSDVDGIQAFYDKLLLGSDKNRLNYLIMELIGFIGTIPSDKAKDKVTLYRAYSLLIAKSNIHPR